MYRLLLELLPEVIIFLAILSVIFIWMLFSDKNDLTTAKRILHEIEKIPKSDKDRQKVEPLLRQIKKIIFTDLVLAIKEKNHLLELIKICKKIIKIEKAANNTQLLEKAQKVLSNLQEKYKMHNQSIESILDNLRYIKIHLLEFSGMDPGIEFSKTTASKILLDEVNCLVRSREEVNKLFDEIQIELEKK